MWEQKPRKAVLYFMGGIVIPLLSFVLSGPLPVMPSSQSGRLDDYVLVLFSSGAIFWFFPYALLSISGLSKFLSGATFSDSVIVRVGIPGGVCLAAPLALLLLIPISGVVRIFMIGGVGILVLHAFLKYATRRFGWSLLRAWLWILFLGLLYVLFTEGWMALVVFPLSAVMGVVVLVVVLGPWVALFTYAMAWIELRRNRSEPLKGSLALWGLWGVGGLLCWSQAIKTTLSVYQKLPTEAPNCFIATAAAQGHPRLTGAVGRRSLKGGAFLCNDQVRHFKGFEMALQAGLPSVHRRLRRWYDWLGPRGAKILRNVPALANVAYVLLKPFEWIAMGLLAVLPGVLQAVNSTYPDQES